MTRAVATLDVAGQPLAAQASSDSVSVRRLGLSRENLSALLGTSSSPTPHRRATEISAAAGSTVRTPPEASDANQLPHSWWLHPTEN
jgi:hypothetical protein